MTRTARISFAITGVACLLMNVHCARQAPAESAAGPANTAGVPAGDGFVTIPADSPQLLEIRIEPVVTARVARDEVVAPGRIEPDVSKVGRVLLPVPGRIDQVYVRLGDAVAAGQPLFTIDSPEADAVLSESRQCQAGLNRAQSALAKAEVDRDRVLDLYEHKAAAKKEVLAAETDLAQARAERDQATAAGEHARRKLEILGLKEGAGSQLVTARAPLAGKVIELSVTAGEYRNDTTTPVMTVADLRTVWVTSAVPENAIRLIDVGERVEVQLIAYPGEVFSARVKRIADVLDPKTRTIQVRAELANPDGRFRPEMFGRIRHSHAAREMPVVPARAVLRQGSAAVLFVERGPGRFKKAAVTIGPAYGEQVVVLEGVKAGDRVVVDGVMLLAGLEAR